MTNNSTNSKRIAKNTLALYARMLFLMIISLYTSRVILLTLGVEDFGIYNVVGSFVALFAVVSKSLSGAASRFLNYEMGRGDQEKLKIVFSSIVTIQIVIAGIIVVLAESFGIWFINYKMIIPPDRLYAANWCFQLSIFTFCNNLITIPYNAAIIAHEHMKTFAYVSIIEGLGKLAISFLILVSPIDKLVFYAILLCLLQITIRAMYRYYCHKNFAECKYQFVYNKSYLKHILSYSGWGFIGSTAGILRNQGINILINLFFGPTVNAARAVANQVLHAVDGFVTNFMTAVRPQIVQSYAANNFDYLNQLIIKSSKFSYCLYFLLSLPVITNADFLLGLWLKQVPDHSASFVQLTLVFTLISTLTHPLSIAQAATGKIRNYQLAVGGLHLLNLPVSYICLKLGCIVESVLIVAVIISFIVVFVSIIMLKKILPFNTKKYIKEVLLRILLISIISSSIAILIQHLTPPLFVYIVLEIIICILTSSIAILFIGCNTEERLFIKEKISGVIAKLNHKK